MTRQGRHRRYNLGLHVLALCVLQQLHASLVVNAAVMDQTNNKTTTKCMWRSPLLKSWSNSRTNCTLNPMFLYSRQFQNDTDGRIRFLRQLAYADLVCLTSYEDMSTCNSDLSCQWMADVSRCHFYFDLEGFNMVRQVACQESVVAKTVTCLLAANRGACPDSCHVISSGPSGWCVTRAIEDLMQLVEAQQGLLTYSPTAWGTCPGLTLAKTLGQDQGMCDTMQNLTACYQARGCSWEEDGCKTTDLVYRVLWMNTERNIAIQEVQEAMSSCAVLKGESPCMAPTIELVIQPADQQLTRSEGAAQRHSSVLVTAIIAVFSVTGGVLLAAGALLLWKHRTRWTCGALSSNVIFPSGPRHNRGPR